MWNGKLATDSPKNVDYEIGETMKKDTLVKFGKLLKILYFIKCQKMYIIHLCLLIGTNK